MKRRWMQIGIGVVLLIMIITLVLNYGKIVVKVAGNISEDVLLIDPGHGGIDGGAVSSRGVSEKAINLAIAQEVKTLAQQAGWHVVMTRETDQGLYTEGAGAIRSLKMQDLKARRDLIRKTNPELTVSIHLNSFKEDPSVRGLQAFYPGTGGDLQILEKSKLLAETLQEKVTALPQTGKTRVALPKSDVYLLKEVTCPIAIIECGFLSNPNEAEMLQSAQYQQDLAKVIFEGITEFSGKKPKKPIKVIDNLKN